jgi:hypothetical protein
MASPALQTTIHTLEGVRFEIYSYRPLTDAEIKREIALYLAARRRKPMTGRTYRVFTSVGIDDERKLL